VASIFGILKAGAAYVPVDSEAPAARCAYILNDCSVRVLIAEQSRVEGLRGELSSFGTPPSLLLTDGSGMDLGRVLQEEDAKDEARRVATVHPDLDTLSYVLYTSGSTGKPKGVMLTHRSATSFVD